MPTMTPTAVDCKISPRSGEENEREARKYFKNLVEARKGKHTCSETRKENTLVEKLERENPKRTISARDGKLHFFLIISNFKSNFKKLKKERFLNLF